MGKRISTQGMGAPVRNKVGYELTKELFNMEVGKSKTILFIEASPEYIESRFQSLNEHERRYKKPRRGFKIKNVLIDTRNPKEKELGLMITRIK